MPWVGEAEEALHSLVLRMLKARPAPPLTNDDPLDYVEWRIYGAWEMPLDIIADTEHPYLIQVYVTSAAGWSDQCVLFNDIAGDYRQEPYEEADFPVDYALQTIIYQALERYTVLDELANL